LRESHPSPPWGRGWPATGVFISRGRTGEGVKPVKTPYPYFKTRSLARTAGQMDKVDAVLRLPNGMIRQSPELFVRKVLSLVWSLTAALG